MIDRGANPFVVAYDGQTRADKVCNLSNLPSKKSVYFTTRLLPNEFKEQNDFLNQWFYTTGVFDGKFDSMIGKGSSGTILSGEWFGKKAAFKFVEIGTQKFQEETEDSLKTLNEKLSEMISIQLTKGSKIVSFYGHYRLGNLFLT